MHIRALVIFDTLITVTIQLALTNSPRVLDLTIFMLTTTIEPITLPLCACARDKKLSICLLFGNGNGISHTIILYKCFLTYIYIRMHAAIIREVENNGDKVTELLQKATNINTEFNMYPNRAMIAAVKNDSFVNVGKLLVHGATNITECLRCAKSAKKPYTHAMLLLIEATQDKDIVVKVYSELAQHLQNISECEDDGFCQVQCQEALLTGHISIGMLFELARLYGNSQVREELLLKTYYVNQEKGYVYWYGLRLMQLEISWLHKVAWVRELNLARNGFKTLPPEIATYLKQVCHVIPVACIFFCGYYNKFNPQHIQCILRKRRL